MQNVRSLLQMNPSSHAVSRLSTFCLFIHTRRTGARERIDKKKLTLQKIKTNKLYEFGGFTNLLNFEVESLYRSAQ